MPSTHQNCLICNSKKLKPIKRYDNVHLINCETCSFKFSSKIPTNKELIKHYDKYGRNDYLSPVTIKRYNELLDTFESYKDTGNLLDVGCGIGYFLEEANKRGWNVYGTEFTFEAIKICKEKGFKIHEGILNPKNYKQKFDIITSFEVIEHINNPQEELKNYDLILRNGGLFYCTTPNFNSLSRKILKEKWNVISYPEHLSYYSPRSLKNLLLNNNFNNIKIKTTGFSINTFKNSIGSNYEEKISPLSNDEKLRIKMEKNKIYSILKTTINFILSFMKLGDSIKVYAIKNK